MSSSVLHVDMDAFYASVEQRDRSELRGLPVVVGGATSGRGVVAAASYEARRFGVHSAMPMAEALRLCPEAVRVPTRMDRYGEVSQAIRAIFHRYTPQVEPLSLDEAFLDVRASVRLFGPPPEIGLAIRAAIRAELGLVASVGIGPNKFIAKLASGHAKPAGFVVVQPDEVQRFLAPLPVDRLWGVGRVASERLKAHGFFTVEQLRRGGPGALRLALGTGGERLCSLVNGVDERPVVPDHRAKSLSGETTFPMDLRDPVLVRARLLELTEGVGDRLRRCGRRAGGVRLKLRYSDFRTISRSRRLERDTDLRGELWTEVARLLDTTWTEPRAALRLVGVAVDRLSGREAEQLELLDETERARRRGVEAALDGVRERFGEGSVRRARELNLGRAPPSGPSRSSNET